MVYAAEKSPCGFSIEAPTPHKGERHRIRGFLKAGVSFTAESKSKANLSTSNVPLISVVDDDRSVVEAIVSLLESVGYTAAGFVSAQDFLRSLQVRRTACLIVDVRMPEIGGLEL